MTQIAIMDFESASIEFYTIPSNIKDEDIEEYAKENLNLTDDCQWMSAEKILISDNRKK